MFKPCLSSMCFPGGSLVDNLPASAGNASSIPGWGRSPGGGNGNPLRYSCLEHPMDTGAWRASSPWGQKRVRHDLVTEQHQCLHVICCSSRELWPPNSGNSQLAGLRVSFTACQFYSHELRECDSKKTQQRRFSTGKGRLNISTLRNRHPGSSAGKESAWSAGDPGSIPESGRSPGGGIGYPLQYSWASLVAHR